MTDTDLPSFDYPGLVAALNAARGERGLDWFATADALWQQSATLNDELGDHRFCGGALSRQPNRDTASCQYALAMLRWLDVPPEQFLVGPLLVPGSRLPRAGMDKRLRWNLPELHEALDRQRREQHLTWTALATVIGGSPGRLTNLRTARQADINLVMRATQWLRRPASDFIRAADW